MTPEKDIFIGPNKVTDIQELELKTHLGYPTLMATYVDGRKHLMTKKYFDQLSSEQPTDYTELRERMTKKIVGELLVVLAEWSPRYEDIPHILDTVQTSNDMNVKDAAEFLYGQWFDVPGVPGYERNMLHVKSVLDKMIIDQNKDEHREDNNSGSDKVSQE